MHYPLAMHPLALMDQRARQEPRGGGRGRCSETKPTGEEDRGLADGDGNRPGWGPRGEGHEGSQLCEGQAAGPT